MQVSALTAIFKADFGRFRPFFGLFRPYRLHRPLADTTRYGRYGPILAESARFGANRSRFGTNRAASARIELSRRESEKKKNADAFRDEGNRVGRRVPRLTRLPACQTASAFFFFFSDSRQLGSIRADAARFVPNRLRFAPNRAVSAISGRIGQRPKQAGNRPKQAGNGRNRP